MMMPPTYVPDLPPLPLSDAARTSLKTGDAKAQANAAAVLIDTMDDARLDRLPIADQLLVAETLAAGGGASAHGVGRTPLVRIVQAMRLPQSYLDGERDWVRFLLKNAGGLLDRKNAKGWAAAEPNARAAALQTLAIITGAGDVSVNLVSKMPVMSQSSVYLSLYNLQFDSNKPIFEINSHPDGVFVRQSDAVCAVIDLATRVRQRNLINGAADGTLELTEDRKIAARILSLSALLAKPNRGHMVCASLPGTAHLKVAVGAAYAWYRPVMDDLHKFLLTDPGPVSRAVAGISAHSNRSTVPMVPR